MPGPELFLLAEIMTIRQIMGGILHKKAPERLIPGPFLLHFLFLHHVQFVFVGIDKFVFQKTQTLIGDNFYTH